MSTSNQTYKDLAIPFFGEVFKEIDGIMQAHKIPCYLIGVSAIALELLKDGIKPSRGTKDIDFAIMISSMAEFESLIISLKEIGFNKTQAPWTFFSEKYNVAVDILPFGEIEQNDTVNFNERYADLHVLGFKEVLSDSNSVLIADKIAQIPPLPGMILLKLVAWSDRPEERDNDLADILKIIEHYFDLKFDEIVDHHYDTWPEDDSFDKMKIGAEVLGRKAKKYLNQSAALNQRITRVLNENLHDSETMEIAKDWAKRRDWEIDYANSILDSFRKGLDLQQ